MHFVNLLSPLIIVPYLIRVLGSGIYGEIVFAQSIMYYLSLFVNFGFNLIATREISLNRDNVSIKSRVVNSIFLTKLTFFLISFCLLLLFIKLTDLNERTIIILTLSMWVVLQEVIICDWYFLGVEKLGLSTFANFTSKVSSIIYIYIYVKAESDYFHVPLAFFLGVIFYTVVTLYQIYRLEKNRFFFVNIREMISLIQESFPIFLSKFSQLYIRLNKVLIGIFMSVELVTIYDIGEKLMNLFKIPITLFGQAIFPEFVNSKNVTRIRRYTVISVLFHLALIIVICIWKNFLMEIFLPKDLGNNYIFFIVLSFTLIPVGINVFIGNTILFGLGFKKQYSKSIALGGFIYLVLGLMFYLYDFWTLISVATLVLISECICTIFTYYYYRKLKIYVKS